MMDAVDSSPGGSSNTVSPPPRVDCLILGGGITGAGVARDASLRGISTLLIDSHDFASGTSHLTSKLIHGGLRYLEHCHFRLVIEGLTERNRLMNDLAPHLVFPLRFIIPFESRRWPKWLLTVSGLQLYGFSEWFRHGRRSVPFFRPGLRRELPLLEPHPLGVSFWDAQTNDARLVMAVLRTAESNGAILSNYTHILSAQFTEGEWVVRLASEASGAEWTCRAKSIVNATGPWSPLTADQLGAESPPLMWIKGSHLLLKTPREFGSDAIIIRSVRNLRPLWVIPWENRLIVGSTESPYRGDLRNVRPSPEEIDDLFESFRRYFPAAGMERSDIRCVYAGVRPIVEQQGESENELSRRHETVVDQERRIITVLGGKLTTFRAMAEQAIDQVERFLDRNTSAHVRGRIRRDALWPHQTGVSAGGTGNGRLVHGQSRSETADRLRGLYGPDADSILRRMADRPDLGIPLFDDLPHTPAELENLARTEHVVHLLDLVKRRTPLYFLADRELVDATPTILDCVAPILGWGADRREQEHAAVEEELRADCAAIHAITPETLPRIGIPSYA